jgi:hypothetical protein
MSGSLELRITWLPLVLGTDWMQYLVLLACSLAAFRMKILGMKRCSLSAYGYESKLELGRYGWVRLAGNLSSCDKKLEGTVLVKLTDNRVHGSVHISFFSLPVATTYLWMRK